MSQQELLSQLEPVCLIARGLVNAFGKDQVPAVLVEKEQITAIGQKALDAKAKRLDLSDLWLCPACIDAHVHLWLKGKPKDNLEKSIKAGIVAVRDMGHSPRAKDPQYPKSQNAPLVQYSGIGLGPKGEAKNWLAHELFGEVEFQKAAQSRLDQGFDLVKLFSTGLLDFENPGEVEHPLPLELSEVKAAVKVAHDAKVKACVHVNGALAVAQALDAGVDSIEHGFFMGQENLQRMADQKVFWSPTLGALQAHILDAENRHPQEIKKNLGEIEQRQISIMRQGEKLGIPFVMGTDAGSYGLEHGKAVFIEMKAWLNAGLKPETVLKACTINAAKSMGLDDKLGEIKIGSKAFLVGVDKDPTLEPTVLADPKWRSF